MMVNLVYREIKIKKEQEGKVKIVTGEIGKKSN
jgi:hypothetical protein